MIKYQNSIDIGSDDREYSMGIYTDAITTDVIANTGVFIENWWRQRQFFRHYRCHSKRLSNAFRKYSESLKFIDCEYFDTRYIIHNSRFIEPDIPYMDYMKDHLNIAYGGRFTDPVEIYVKRKTICDEIKNIMTTPHASIPHGPTFETIIRNKIKVNCPNLKETELNDLDPSATDFYIRHHVFNIIFEVVSGRRTISLSTKQMSDDVHDLIHRSTTTIARGDNTSIIKLKSTLEEIVTNEQIRSIVGKYYELKNTLTNDNDIKHLVAFANRLYYDTRDGALLAGFGSCKHCKPDELKDVQIS